MQIQRISSIPILLIDGFMTAEQASDVYQECLDLKPVYMPATIGTLEGEQSKTSLRRHEVVYLGEVFRPAPARSRILRHVQSVLRSKEMTEALAGPLLYDILNYSNHREAVLSRYGNCDFFGTHRDTIPGQPRRRIVTLVYYVNSQPERFEGGAITFQVGQEQLRIVPKHNRAVIFPSATVHSVEPVKLDSEEWGAGRFSINYWAGFKDAPVPQGGR